MNTEPSGLSSDTRRTILETKDEQMQNKVTGLVKSLLITLHLLFQIYRSLPRGSHKPNGSVHSQTDRVGKPYLSAKTILDFDSHVLLFALHNVAAGH